MAEPSSVSDAHKRAVLKQLLRAARDGASRRVDERIAVVGMAGRYPGAPDLDAFWENLAAGRSSIREVPAERWDWRAEAGEGAHPAGPKERKGIYTRWGGFIDDVDRFDPLFFNVSPLEAEAMDPQERLFLQTAWHALEDAGCTRRKLAGQLGGEVGVFVGVMNSHYEWFNAEARQRGTISGAHSHFWSLANRVSYFLNLTGPSFAVDSACSASLTAVHLACESLRRGECRAAIAGGVNLILHPLHYHKLCLLEMLSPAGECRPFGAGADGFVDGEGVGALILKPLRAALADGDRIHGVILGSAINAGGKTGGYTVPNPQAQAKLVQRALARAGVAAGSLSYIEAHGTGTALGDPIEVAALRQVFAAEGATNAKPVCAIGSVKSNIGHLESAAGVAGLTKVLLQLRHQTLAPSIHADELNPKIDWADSPLTVQRSVAEWRAPESVGVRRAGVSSFGAGGANAHVIVEEFVDGSQSDLEPEAPWQGRPRTWTAPHAANMGGTPMPQHGQDARATTESGAELIVLSARNEDRLRAHARRMAAFLNAAEHEGRAPSLRDLGWTLRTGREPMEARAAFVAGSMREAAEKFSALAEGGAAGIWQGRVGRGQGLADLIGHDAAARDFVQGLLAAGDVERVARWWVEGAEVDWSAWRPHVAGRIVSLPLYPFASDRYWLAGGGAPAGAAVSPAREPAVTVFVPEWRDAPVTTAETIGPLTVVAPAAEEGVVRTAWEKAGGRAEDLTIAAANVGAGGRVLWLAREPGGDPFEEFAAVLGWVQRWLEARVAEPRRLVYVARDDAEATAAVRGLLRTVAAERPEVSARVSVVALEDPAEFWRAALTEALVDDREARVDEDRRSARQWRRVELPEPARAWRDRGVYVITGGLGGVGRSCARHLARTCRARLALIGRAAIDPAAEAFLGELRAAGGEAEYFRVDLADRGACERAWAEIRARFGAVHGILHAAGVTRDRALGEKTRAEAEAVFAGKVRGIVNLDAVSAGERLERVVLFGSVAGVLGNAGQADYAGANALLDAFAAERNRAVARGERFGRTVAIDWPLWAAGRMTLDAGRAERARERFGLEPLPESAALAVLDAAAAGTHEQVLVWSGAPEWIEGALNGVEVTPRSVQAQPDRVNCRSELARDSERQSPAPAFALLRSDESRLLHHAASGCDDFSAEIPFDSLNTAKAGSVDLRAATQAFLQELIATPIKLAPAQIEPERRFEDYGIDSVMVRAFNARLEQTLPGVSATLLFEHPTLRSLTDHLVATRGAELARVLLAGGGEREPFGLRTIETLTRSATDSGERLDETLTRSATGGGEPVLSGREESGPTPVDDEPIAIVGMSGRYPGAANLEEFWRNLAAGRDCVTEVPRERWDATRFADKAYCQRGGFLADADKFDPLFFGISPLEAKAMDPQERIFLELAWEAIEDAGYARGAMERNVGVFVGVTTHGYALFGPEALAQGRPVLPSSVPWSLANRVSFLFDFTGPSLPIDTACSASLTALHVACESLRRGECAAALVGGVNLYLHPLKYVVMCQTRMLSRSGHCHSFGEGGDGFIPGEGGGALLLKPLARAKADGDRIHGLIRGTAVNHGGRTNGYTVPNPRAQAELIRQAWRAARVDPRTVTCLEAHGTGTELGDPIEVEGLTQAFRAFTPERQFCALGSVKSAIGHLESAAGIAGVTKVLLQMKHGRIAPTLHAETPNRAIDFANSPFVLQRELAEWQRLEIADADAGGSGATRVVPRRAGVSSFGAGGANAHVVLEEYIDARVVVPANQPGPQVLVLSARDRERLRAYAERLRECVGRMAATDPLAELAWTLQTGRVALPERLAIVASNPDEARRAVEAWLAGRESGAVFSGRATTGGGAAAASAAGPEESAARWVRGEPVDWRALHPAGGRRRTAAPTYPFARERYWFDDAAPAESAAPETSGRETVPWYGRMPGEIDFGAPGEAVGLEWIDGEIALVRLQDRENHNMFSEQLLRGLLVRFSEIARRPEVKVVVVTGSGNVFSMGGTREGLTGLAEKKARFTDVPFLYRGLLECPVPVIAAVQGHASGGGLLFGLYADVAVLAEEGVYASNFLKYGFTPGMGATLILPEKLGPQLATEMMFTAASLTGEELRRRGAGVRVRPAERVLDEALALARTLAEKPRAALAELKRELSGRLLARMPEVLARELAMHERTLGAPEVRARIEEVFGAGGGEGRRGDPPSPSLRRAGAETRRHGDGQTAGFAEAVRALRSERAEADREPRAAVGAGAAEPEVREFIFSLLQRLLHLRRETIDVEASFAQLGLDSISGVELIRDLNKRFGLSLEAVVLYDHGSVAKLAAFVAGRVPRAEQSEVAAAALAPAEPSPPVVASPGKVALRNLGGAAVVSRPQPAEPPRRVTLPVPAAAAEPAWPEHAIAVVGIACRYPGAGDKEAFWRNLERGVDAIAEVPAERHWPREAGEAFARTGGFLSEIDQFDAEFFKLLPVEAEYMEPQQRLFLEECWKALEDGGFAASALAGRKCGVFVGASTGDYFNALEWRGREHQIAHAFTGGSPSILAARIAYHLDLTGPSVALDTACSSSLVAVHQACRSILDGDAELALAGGVSLMLTPQTHVMTARAGMLSPSGRCRPFDRQADGIVISEGVGVVVLQRLSQARAERRRIYGVIRGSAVNQDGRTNGIMAPSARSQASLLAEAQARAGVGAGDISFVETHGTGTALGDPIEVNALRTVFGPAAEGRCALGSVKSNIGHTMLAAGVAGLIKALLALQHRRLPATLHFTAENEHLRLAGSPFFVNTQPVPWEPAPCGRRIAGVSSFGFSGTNAHVIVEEYPAVAERASAAAMPGPVPILLSARDDAALGRVMAGLDAWLAEAGATVSLRDIAYTLANGRSHHAVRRAFTVGSIAELRARLAAGAEARAMTDPAWAEVCARFAAGEDVSGDTARLDGAIASLPGYPLARRRFWIDARPSAPAAVPTEAPVAVRAPAAASGNAVEYVRRLVAEETKLEPAAIDVTADFEACGLNSVVIAGLNRRLERDFGPLPATLFFTYKSVAAVAAYLELDYGGRLAEIGAQGGTEVHSVQQSWAGRPWHDTGRMPVPPQTADAEPIAIIGMSGRFPQAEDLEAFWENLRAGRDCVTEIPADRWDYRQFWAEGAGKREGIYCKWGGFVADADKFDPAFFNIAPREARFMDPQERIFLEAVWSCLEDAGCTRARLREGAAADGRAPVGVFAGVSLTDYQMHGGEAWGRGEAMPVNSQIYAIANRVSYFLNLGGPSLPVDTACSSSLYAVHLACESIRRGECRMALAGGVNLSLHPNKYLTLCLGQFAASDGRCRAFGEGGDGYVPADGVGVILLKPLSAALRDGDPVRAVIRGTAVNHDGKTHGFTVPNPVAQTEVIRAALARAGLSADALTCIEAHGTGTALGDPIEVAGLSEAFAADTARKQFCAIGSVKSNIGHAEAAAGIAQLIKVVLQLEHRTLVPNLLHSERTNPHIDFARTPFRVQLGCGPWEPNAAGVRCAGVSSFGVGGVNVHAIVEEPPAVAEAENGADAGGPMLIPLSAKSEYSLRAGARRLREFLARAVDASRPPRLGDVAWTLQTGREPMPVRAAFVAATTAEAIERLREIEERPRPTGEASATGGPAFGSDPEDRAYLRELIRERKLEKLARLWAQGAAIAWEALWEGRPRAARISLPTYAFQRERYWQFEPAPVTEPAAPQRPAPPDGSRPLRERLAAADAAGRLEILTAHVQGIVGELLAFSPPSATPLDRGLFDLGMESVQNAQLVARLAADTGIELYPTVAFDYPNVRALATHLAHTFGAKPAAVAPAAADAASAAPAAIETFFVQDAWEPANLPAPSVGAHDGGVVLLLAHDDEARAAVTEALRARGDLGRVVLARPGHEFVREREDVFTIDTRVPAHYGQLVAAIGGGALRVLHGWSARPFATQPEILRAQIERGPLAVFHLTQALMRRTEKSGVRLIAAGLAGAEPAPHFVALRALLRSIAQENPAYDYRLVESARGGAALAASDWAGCVDELLRNAGAGAEVRHEPGRRLVRVLREFAPAAAEERAWQERGVYLIAGGLGGLGLRLAEHLATACRARLVLVGRSVARDGALRALEAAGAEVLHVRADLATRAGAEAAVAAAREKFGGIDGVFHAAGVLRDAFVPNKQAADWDDVLAPKVAGTIHLDAATGELPLQFFAVFSSLTAAVGNAGQTDYAYANSFQEQFVAWRARQAGEGRRAGRSIAINWPLWADGGMKVDAAMETFLRDVIGLASLPAAAGWRVLEQAIAGGTDGGFTVLHGVKTKIATHLKLRLRGGGAAGASESELEAALEAELRAAQQQLESHG